MNVLIWAEDDKGLVVNGARRQEFATKPDLPFPFDYLYYEPTRRVRLHEHAWRNLDAA